MTEDEKLQELVSQVREIFPAHVVDARGLDADLRWPIDVLYESDLMRSRRFTVPRDALDDLDSAQVSSFIQQAEDDGWWEQNRGRTLHIGYDVGIGLLRIHGPSHALGPSLETENGPPDPPSLRTGRRQMPLLRFRGKQRSSS